MEKAEKKSGHKTLKAQLFSAIAMMIVATVALGTSTYAWFVNSAAPKVDAMEFTASSAKSLLIAVNKQNTTLNNPGDFKGVITNTDIVGMGTVGNNKYASFFTTQLSPASVTTDSLLPNAGTPSTLPTAFFKDKNMNATTAKFDQFEPVQDFASSVKMIPLYFKSSEDMNVYLKAAQGATETGILVKKTAAAGGTVKTTAELNGMTEAERAIWVNPIYASGLGGSYTLNGSGTSALQKLFDDEFALIKKSVRIGFTAVNGVKGDGTLGGSDNFVLIYEPDRAHLAGSVDTTDWNGQSADTTTAGGMSAINAINGENKISAINPQYTYDDATTMKYVVSTDANTLTAAPDGKDRLFQLKKDTVKQMNVYIWLEGTDFDCISAVASGHFGVNLSFIGAPVTIAP